MSKDNTGTINPEDYRSMTAPGLDCPVCQVDTGDSYHFKSCWIGQELGEALRDD